MTSLLSLLIVFQAAACRDVVDPAWPPMPPAADAGGPSREILDATRDGGLPGFYFLPPLVSRSAYGGEFDGGLSPAVEICEWSGIGCGPVVAAFSTSQGTGSEALRLAEDGEHYVVNWHTDRFALLAGRVYRIRVLVAGTELGFADVQVTDGKGMKDVDTGAFVPLTEGRTLPIKFRIEQGAVHVVGPEGGRVATRDGSVELDIPPGALAESVGITISPGDASPADVALVRRTAYEFRPDRLSFAAPVQLTIAYDPVDVPGAYFESSLRIFRAGAGGWTALDSGGTDIAMRTVTTRIDGFSTYAALATEVQATPPGTFPVAPSPGSYGVTDSHVVWLDRRSIDPLRCQALDALAQCFPDLFVFDLTTAVEARVTPPGALPIDGRLAVSGLRIAWADTRSSPRPQEIHLEELHTLELATGATLRHSGPGNPSDALGSHRGFVLSGDRLAWWELRAPAPGVPTVVLLDVIGGSRAAFPIGTSPFAAGLAMDGNTVVWRTAGSVVALDLGTGVQTLVSTGSISGAPAISGSRIVWAEERGGNVDVYLFDLGTGMETRITTDGAAQFAPDISGDRVVWADRRNDGGSLSNLDVYMLDLSTGIEAQVSRDPGTERNPRISGSHVVWHDSRTSGLVAFRIL